MFSFMDDSSNFYVNYNIMILFEEHYKSILRMEDFFIIIYWELNLNFPIIQRILI